MSSQYDKNKWAENEGKSGRNSPYMGTDVDWHTKDEMEKHNRRGQNSRNSGYTSHTEDDSGWSIKGILVMVAIVIGILVYFLTSI